MKILVCIKQVPSTNNVKVDNKTGVIIRSGVDSKMNPFDLYALEYALQIKNKINATVDVITMGPPQADEILYEALSMGADNAAIVSDRAFGGADVLATSYTLSQAINKFNKFDLILCGKQTTDGDTAQVGAEIAEFLGIDHATNILKITEVNENNITVQMNLGYCEYLQKMNFPCLLTIEKDANVPRLPSFLRKKALKPKQYEVITLNDLDDKNKNNYGLSGSPTKVERIFPPEKNTEKITLKGTSKEISQNLLKTLKDKKILV